jgi:hypothetical protein
VGQSEDVVVPGTICSYEKISAVPYQLATLMSACVDEVTNQNAGNRPKDADGSPIDMAVEIHASN